MRADEWYPPAQGPPPSGPRSLGSLLLSVLMSEHDAGMTQGIGKHGQSLPSGLGGSAQKHTQCWGMSQTPPTSRPHCLVPSVPYGLFPRASAPAALSANKTFSNPLTFWANSTFTRDPPQASVLERLCPWRARVSAPVMSKPVSHTRLRHVHLCSSGPAVGSALSGDKILLSVTQLAAWWSPSPGPLQAPGLCHPQEERSHR